MNRDAIIRDTAYALWEAEGKPDGRSQQHWFMAEQQVARNTKGDAAAKNGAGRGKANAEAPGKAPARKATGKAPAAPKR